MFKKPFPSVGCEEISLPQRGAVGDGWNTRGEREGPTAESRKADDLARKSPADQGDREPASEGDVKTVIVAHRISR